MYLFFLAQSTQDSLLKLSFLILYSFQPLFGLTMNEPYSKKVIFFWLFFHCFMIVHSRSIAILVELLFRLQTGTSINAIHLYTKCSALIL